MISQMASNLYTMNSILFTFLLLIFSLSSFSSATPRVLALVKPNPTTLKYHNGQLLKGNITVNLIWYGKFTPAQRSIILDFLQSLSHRSSPPPSAESWWRTTANYKGGPCNIVLGKQGLDQKYSLGKSLKDAQIRALASKAGVGPAAISVVLTGADVAVDGFCMSRCGTHGYTRSKNSGKYAYAWVGNSVTQCPGQCAWPFQKPIVGLIQPCPIYQPMRRRQPKLPSSIPRAQLVQENVLHG